jgi:hypothetical protein
MPMSTMGIHTFKNITTQSQGTASTAKFKSN